MVKERVSFSKWENKRRDLFGSEEKEIERWDKGEEYNKVLELM